MSECDLPLFPLILLQVRISDPLRDPPKMFDSNSSPHPPPTFVESSPEARLFGVFSRHFECRHDDGPFGDLRAHSV